MRFTDLTRNEQAQIDTLIHHAYVRPDGTTRTHAEAAQEFAVTMQSAQQSGTEWADLLAEAWFEAGMRTFIQKRWKHGEMFKFFHRGKERTRTTKRGVKRADDTGKVASTQLALFEWTAADLRAAIADAGRQIAEHSANIALYRDMLELMESTGAVTFQAALATQGTTWDAWIEARAA